MTSIRTARAAFLRSRRRGVTLIELLVVMAIITALSLLALMLIPSVTNSDATLKGTEEVRANLRIAQALAAGSRQPRGVRFLTAPGAGRGARHAKELQFLESPPITVFDPQTLRGGRTGNTDGVSGPRVDISYTVAPSGSTNPAAGTITNRQCVLFGLSAAQLTQVKPGALLVLPTMGFWARINSNPTPNGGGQEVELDVYPDTYMGASTHFRTYHAGIYGPPVPLLGQPTILLPTKIAVDLDLCMPPAEDPSGSVPTYDLMFAPDGQLISVKGVSSNVGVYLWVRDVEKNVNPGTANPKSLYPGHFPGGTATTATAGWVAGLRRGGEHHAVGISNGFIGAEPIQWPDDNGFYPDLPVAAPPADRANITYAFSPVRKKLR